MSAHSKTNDRKRKPRARHRRASAQKNVFEKRNCVADASLWAQVHCFIPLDIPRGRMRRTACQSHLSVLHYTTHSKEQHYIASAR